MSVTDLAFYILKNRGQAIHFKELISEIMRVKAISQENPGRLIAQMHTEINLDSRFLHQGNGEWGLREWLPRNGKIVKIRPETPGVPKSTRPELQPEDEEEDEEFGLEPDELEEEFVDEEVDDTEESDDYYQEEE